MKKIILLSIIQAFVLFCILGTLTYFIKGDFFYRYLSIIFAVLAGFFRFISSMIIKIVIPNFYDSKSKK
ncbi:MAG: hypothetical protein Q4A90_07020 [Streptococcus sp.]|nr:hypothetical protein [Streptococcus sp.]